MLFWGSNVVGTIMGGIGEAWPGKQNHSNWRLSVTLKNRAGSLEGGALEIFYSFWAVRVLSTHYHLYLYWPLLLNAFAMCGSSTRDVRKVDHKNDSTVVDVGAD